MEFPSQQRITRRRFLVAGACAGAGLALYAGEIERHIKKSHGKTVKAADCLTTAACKQTEWFQDRAKIADRFKKAK